MSEAIDEKAPEATPAENTVPSALYPCYLPSCGVEVARPPEELFWTQEGADGQGPGWYCRVCLGEFTAGTEGVRALRRALVDEFLGTVEKTLKDAWEDAPAADRIADGGPYRVEGNVNGTLMVYPEWRALDGKPGWMRRSREDNDAAGGPGLFSRMALADDIASLLNRAAGCGDMKQDDGPDQE